MYITFIADFISFSLLIYAFFMLWKARFNFSSLKPFAISMALLSVGRICDMLLEHRNIHLHDLYAVQLVSVEVIVAIIGNIADAMAVAFLISGFIKTIKFEQAEETHILELEQMLPLCANCKKYRSDDGTWMPIEKYLIDSGAPKLTHGICPECAEKLYGYTSAK